MSDNWDITTGDGSVSLYLPTGFGAELDAHTGDGTIRNDLDVVGERAGDNRRARSEPPHAPRTARRRRQTASHPHRRRRRSG